MKSAQAPSPRSITEIVLNVLYKPKKIEKKKGKILRKSDVKS